MNLGEKNSSCPIILSILPLEIHSFGIFLNELGSEVRHRRNTWFGHTRSCLFSHHTAVVEGVLEYYWPLFEIWAVVSLSNGAHFPGSMNEDAVRFP